MKTLIILIFLFQGIQIIGQIDTLVWDYSKLQMVNQKYEDGYHIFKKNGIIIKEFNIEKGISIGTCKDYYDNGNLKFTYETKYFQNRPYTSGPNNEYYESGKIKIEGHYEYADSIECINCFELYENKIKTKAYSNSTRSGKWKEYYENGKLKSIGLYKGIHEVYSSHIPKFLNTKSYGVFQPGSYFEEYLKNKDWKYYNDKEQLIKEEYYYNGVIADIKTYEQ